GPPDQTRRSGYVDFDVVDTGGVPGRGDVAPGYGHGGFAAVAEVDLAHVGGQRHADDFAAAPHLAAIGHALDRGLGGARRKTGTGIETERQVGGVRQGPGQVGRHTVGGNDVETDAGAQHDTGLPGGAGAVEGRLEHGDFSGDVQLVG